MRKALSCVAVVALGLCAYLYLGPGPADYGTDSGRTAATADVAARGSTAVTPGIPAGQAWAAPDPGAEPGRPASLQVQPDSPLLRAQLRPKRLAMLSSQMPGRISDVLAMDGEPIVAGQILFRLDCSLPEAQLERARAVKSRKDKAWAVTAQLVGLKSRSVLEAEVARAEAAEAAAEVKVAEAFVGRCTVKAPFDGRAGEVLARAGQYVTEGQAVMEVFSDGELEVEFVAPSRLIGVLRPGLRFQIEIDETGTSLEAQLDRLGGRVDPVSQSVRVYARIVRQPPGLMAGMSGLARLEAVK